MTSDRCYRTAVPNETACQELLRCSAASSTPAVVQAFLAVIGTHGDEREPDAAQDAAAHIRTLLGAGMRGALAS